MLALATRATEAAAAALAQDEGEARKVRLDSGRDIKIVADGTAEKAILTCLRDGSDLSILTEESGPIKGCGGGADHRWIVDPLDGSLNFSRGIPLSCISVALWNGDEPVLGVIRDSFHGDLFTGMVGEGAWLNGTTMKTSGVAVKAAAVLCTGFPIATDFSTNAIQTFVNQVAEFKKVRLFGSAALSLAYVASGRVDAYVEKDIRLWDVAAGVALVKAAGGSVKMAQTADDQTFVVEADNGHSLF